MTDETRRNDQSKMLDARAIGWSVHGLVSGHEQGTIHCQAMLGSGKPSLQSEYLGATLSSFPTYGQTRSVSGLFAPVEARSQLSTNPLDISLSRAFGQTANDMSEISSILWNEVCVSEECGHALSESGVSVRISDDIDPSWAQSLLYSAEDSVSLDRDVLISRPIISDASATLSLVLSDSIPVSSANHWSADKSRHPSRQKGNNRWTCAKERRASTDIGFCTLEAKLLSNDHTCVKEGSALHLLDARRNSPVRDKSLGVSFNISSMYLHPTYRKRGLGRLLASFAKAIIAFTIDELVEQIAYRNYVLNGKSSGPYASGRGLVGMPPGGGALDILVCGRSVDNRSDRLFHAIVSGILAQYGDDLLSPASTDANGDASRLRSFALVCNKVMAANPGHHESEVLARLLERIGAMHTFHPCRARSSPWGNVVTTAVDLVDWRNDR